MAPWFVDRCASRGIPSVSLRSLLPEAQFLGCRDLVVSGCSADSRRLEPGQLFVAVRDSHRDGHDFVAQAQERGAVGVLAEQPCPEAGALQVVVPDTRSAHARLCQALAGSPSQTIPVLGIAGGHGKTTTGLFLSAIARAARLRHGMIGSVDWAEGDDRLRCGSITPGPLALAERLAASVEQGDKASILAVTTESLERRAVDGISFAAAVVTRLGAETQVDEQRRRRAQTARLMRRIIPGGVAILDADDPDVALLGAVNLDASPLTYALDRPADVRGRVERLDLAGSRVRIQGFGTEIRVELSLVGLANVRYALAAAAAAWTLRLPTDAVIDGLEELTAVPGRLERVAGDWPFTVLVDRARNASSLARALRAAREVSAGGTVHCVVGAEGGSTLSDRLALARVAESAADRLILTTGNARVEDPEQLLDDLRAGLRAPARVPTLLDRRDAIAQALQNARPGDVVLLAGQGHHGWQYDDNRMKTCDDATAATAWQRHQGLPTRRLSA